MTAEAADRSPPIDTQSDVAHFAPFGPMADRNLYAAKAGGRDQTVVTDRTADEASAERQG